MFRPRITIEIAVVSPDAHCVRLKKESRQTRIIYVCIDADKGSKYSGEICIAAHLLRAKLGESTLHSLDARSLSYCNFRSQSCWKSEIYRLCNNIDIVYMCTSLTHCLVSARGNLRSQRLPPGRQIEPQPRNAPQIYALQVLYAHTSIITRNINRANRPIT